MFVAKWYTRASRVRIVIAKFDGRWTLPGGPYPIPELVALVSGLLCTLMLLPRLGQPVLTLIIGAGATAMAVAAMRRMPYSPVPFATRVHRIARLYTNPSSTTSSHLERGAETVSTVRPSVAILASTPAHAPAPARRRAKPAPPARLGLEAGWDELFERQSGAAADLFS
jgi:hypothetical protein